MPSETPRNRWWDHPLLKGIGGLAVALFVTFLPLAIDAIRARRPAKPIEIVASEPTREFSYEVRSGVTTPAAAPESIVVAVVITSTGTGSARTTVRQYCPVMIQLRRAQSDTARIVWSGPERTCLTRGREIRLEPGQSDTLRASEAIRNVLGDSLPGGRYSVSAVFEIDGETVTRAAGELDLRLRAR